MKSQPITAIYFIAALVGCASISCASDANKSGEIKIPLKDFKFKAPKSVTDSDSAFVLNEEDAKLCFYTNGSAEAKFTAPASPEWDVIVTASGDTAVGVPVEGKQKDIHPNFQLGFDGKDFGKEITLKSDDAQDYKVVVPLTAGEHVISIAFTNDTYDPDGKFDSNFYLHSIKLQPHKTGTP